MWPENWDSVVAFLACETQWRMASTFSRVWPVGLVYSDVDVVLKRFASPPHVFDDLLFMERAVLKVFREQD